MFLETQDAFVLTPHTKQLGDGLALALVSSSINLTVPQCDHCLSHYIFRYECDCLWEISLGIKENERIFFPGDLLS